MQDILRCSPEENLALIRETAEYLRRKGRQVIFDAEHFFEAYRANAAYALLCLQAARDGGAACVVLCDTNGADHAGRNRRRHGHRGSCPA